MGGRRGSCRRQHAPTEDEHVLSRARPFLLRNACCLTGRRHVSGVVGIVVPRFRIRCKRKKSLSGGGKPCSYSPPIGADVASQLSMFHETVFTKSVGRSMLDQALHCTHLAADPLFKASARERARTAWAWFSNRSHGRFGGDDDDDDGEDSGLRYKARQDKASLVELKSAPGPLGFSLRRRCSVVGNGDVDGWWV